MAKLLKAYLKMAGMRDELVHASVSALSIVWETVKNDLLVLKRQVELLLKELENASLLICG